jgi:predicted esterase
MRLLLVHGMGRTPLSLARLARFLWREGHRVERLGYVAAFETFESIRARVRRKLERVTEQASRWPRRISLRDWPVDSSGSGPTESYAETAANC